MKTAFGTVVYESAWKYIDEFCKSLNAQTTQEFTMLIVCDNLSKLHIQNLKQKFAQKVIIIPITENMSIPAIRITLIKKAKQHGFDLLILGDFDDIFEQDRINKIIKTFKLNPEYAFYYNKLVDFSGKSVFTILPEKIDGIETILEHNFCGLSNTALNLRLLDKNFITSLFECDSLIFDWYLFSRILLYGYKGRYVADTETLYRIYINNIAGIPSGKQADMEKELSIKRAHYALLKNTNFKIYSLYEIYSKLTIESLKSDKVSYQNKILHGYWWEQIKVN